VIAVLQRVAAARVEIEGELVGAIDAGLLVLVCAEPADTPATASKLVPQFTLAADTRSGTRPSFTGAAPPDEGRRLFEKFVTLARQTHTPVGTGVFGADMKVSLINDGPVTLWLRQEPKAESST